jgi:pimeloyl-ACP methyl ester carboxylesterase
MREPLAAYTTASIVSRDGTTVGYRRMGRGPAVVLVHGGMMASQNLMNLGAALAGNFTVYLPDRRGRGLSGPLGEQFGIVKAVEDLQALIAHTGCEHIFGVSAGAIVVLYAAAATPSVRKVVAYEPPFALASIPESSPASWLPRYEAEIAQGRLAEALVTVSKGVRSGRLFSALPRFVTVPLMKLALPAEAREVKPGDIPLRDLIPTMHHDAQIVLDTADKLEELGALRAQVLLLGGGSSPAYFKRISSAVRKSIPGAAYVELPGLGHMSADNGGRPSRIAQELCRFFQMEKPLPEAP